MKSKRAIGIFGFILAVILVWLVWGSGIATVHHEATKELDGKRNVMTFSIVVGDNVNLDMIWIKPGTFKMGSSKSELGRFSGESRHKVKLTKGYWLGKYEVTQAQYEAIMGTNPSYFKGADNPVEKVNWNDAMAFCKKLTEMEKNAGRLPEGYEYTLPTEAQWEYACRAGTTTAFNNGTNIPIEEQIYDEPCPNMDEVGWYSYNSDDRTHPVGQKKPNAWGLYDMHGNVFEWCLDLSGNYPTKSMISYLIKPVIDPMGPSVNYYLNHVVRGGSWSDRANGCRSAYRDNSYSNSFDHYGGFRVALAPVQ